MKGIEINGEKLHKIRMKEKPTYFGTTVTMNYPKSQINYNFEGRNDFIEVPAFLAVELYKRGLIPQDEKEFVEIKESGKRIGDFLFQKVSYPSGLGCMKITFFLQNKGNIDE